MIDFSKFNNLISLITYFKNDKVCKQFLAKQRWGKEVACPVCGSAHCYTRKDGRYRCADCHTTLSVLKGTIFENTNIPLVKWFSAMYLLSCHNKGIASTQLAKDIHVTQKTAWFILQKVRTLYENNDVALSGTVECDEVFIGGKETNKHESKKVKGTQGRSTKTNKTPVFGMVERGGAVVAQKVVDTKGKTIKPIISQYVEKGSNVMTDELTSYNGLNREYNHSVVHHHQKEFVVGNAYTNTMEGFWGQIRRMIIGVYHHISEKYMQRYVNEAAFRYNSRHFEACDRFEHLLYRAAFCSVTYQCVKSKI